MHRILDLCHEKGKHEAARFYLDVLAILEETKTEAKVKEKINEAFKNAQQTPLKTVDQLVLEIESSAQSKPSPRLHQKKQPKIKQQRLKKKNLQNLSAKANDKVSQREKCMPFTWDQNEAELQEENKCLQSIDELQKRFNTHGYKLHPRILRWVGVTTDQIKKFDVNNKNKKIHYADLTEEDITLRKTYHDLKGVELLLCVDDHKDYFFDTPKGKGAFAIYVKKDVKKEGAVKKVEGIFEVGISDEGYIYHMMFNDKVEHRPEQLFQLTHPRCNKTGFEIAKQDGTYMVSLGIPTSINSSTPLPHKKLFILPNKLSIKSITKFRKLADGS